MTTRPDSDPFEVRADGALTRGGLLLTGATGFLGAHLLHEVLLRSDASVTCLVRGESDGAAEESARRRLGWYFPEISWAAHAGRLRFLAGDIAARTLGMDPRRHDELAQTCSMVINAAADVNHVGAPSQSFRVNTDGVANLIEFARRGAAKELHHVSTVSVQGHASRTTPFDESHLEQGQTFRNAYSESKYRAEVLLRKAFAEGLRGAVYRVGYIGPHGITGRFQRNVHQNHTARYLRGCIALGFAPHLPAAKLRLTPVDSVARGILLLANRSRVSGNTFYVVTPHELAVAGILGVLHAAGYAVRLMTPQDFAEKARRLSRDEEALATMAPAKPGTEGAVAFDDMASQSELARLGFEFPRPNAEWLFKFLSHIIQEGFIEAPRFWNSAALVPVPL
jgi:thioester reductase-like protein